MPSTDLDLTAAVAAAARNAYADECKSLDEYRRKSGRPVDPRRTFDELPQLVANEYREHVLPIVLTAAPLIAGQAVDLEAARVPDHDAGLYLTEVARGYYEEAGA